MKKTINFKLSQVGATVIIQYLPIDKQNEKARQKCLDCAKELYEAIESAAFKAYASDLEREWQSESD